MTPQERKQAALLRLISIGVKGQATAAARRIYTRARLNGSLRLRRCVVCRSEDEICGHHVNYEKPLLVVELCATSPFTGSFAG